MIYIVINAPGKPFISAQLVSPGNLCKCIITRWMHGIVGRASLVWPPACMLLNTQINSAIWTATISQQHLASSKYKYTFSSINAVYTIRKPCKSHFIERSLFVYSYKSLFRWINSETLQNQPKDAWYRATKAFKPIVSAMVHPLKLCFIYWKEFIVL